VPVPLRLHGIAPQYRNRRHSLDPAAATFRVLEVMHRSVFQASRRYDALPALRDSEHRVPAQRAAGGRRQAAQHPELAPGWERLAGPKRDLDRVARRDIRDRELRDRMEDLHGLFLDLLGRDGVDLEVRGGGSVERGAEVERETGEDRLAGRLALLVGLALEERLLANDHRLSRYGRWSRSPRGTR
jgi:hypothetical protein